LIEPIRLILLKDIRILLIGEGIMISPGQASIFPTENIWPDICNKAGGDDVY